MNLPELCQLIELQQEITSEVEKFYNSFDFKTVQEELQKLKNMNTEKEARAHLNQIFPDDTDQIKMLTCMLICAVDIYQFYLTKGIPKQIYIDTMKCFTRFISECKNKTGKFAFDRAFWTARQINALLFRIGELEYEMTTINEKPIVSVHIPSDAIFTDEKCTESLNEAKKFFARFFPTFNGVDYMCESWLLMPELKTFLSKDSNIIKFQNRFEIKEVIYEDKEYLEWVFKTRNCEIKDLPEKTTLQRKLKDHLLKGGKFGSALGYLKK